MSEPSPVETGVLETAIGELDIESNYKPPPEKSLEELLSADKEDESLQKYKEALLGEAKVGKVIVDPQDERKVIVKRLALCVEGRPDMELDLTKPLENLKKQYLRTRLIWVPGRLIRKSVANSISNLPMFDSEYFSFEPRIRIFALSSKSVGLLLANDIYVYDRCWCTNIIWIAMNSLIWQVFVIKEGISYRIRIDFIVQREIVHGLKYVQKTYRLGTRVDKMTHMVGSYPPKSELQSYTTPPEDAPTGVIARGSYTIHSLFTDDDQHIHLKWEWSFEIKKDWKD